MPGCHGVRQTGVGRIELKTGRIAVITTKVMTTPKTAPQKRSACAPAGRTATRRRAPAHSHADTNHPALRLDHATREVERPEGSAGQDKGGEDVPELLVALDVVVEHSIRLVVLGLCHRHPEAGARLGEGRLDCAGSGLGVDSRCQHEDQVVHPARSPRQSLRRFQRREQDRELGFREEPALFGHHEEVLGLYVWPTLVTSWLAATRSVRWGGKVVEVGEVALDQHHGLADVRLGQRAPLALGDQRAVDVRAAVAEVHSDKATGHEDRLVRVLGVDLGVGNEPLLGGGHDPRIGRAASTAAISPVGASTPSAAVTRRSYMCSMAKDSSFD